MNKMIIVFILVSSSALCSAQDQSPIKLQCEGTYSDFSKPDIRDIPVKGIYIEISGNRVTVLGAPGFDSTYSVINRMENGLGIQLDSDRSYEGFLNRFSGELSLMEKDNIAKDGSYKIKQMLSAVCYKARSLF
jgi:hypothetical protein